MSDVRVGLIGAGYWGRHYVRLLRHHPGAQLAFVVEPSPAARASLPVEVPVYSSIAEVPPAVVADGVVVVTPASTHTEVVRAALGRGWSVLVEKPFAPSLAAAEGLAREAAERGLTLYPGHVYAHSGPALELARRARAPAFGPILHIVSLRMSLGIVRNDVSVVRDFAPHDLTLVDLLPVPWPDRVLAVGTHRLDGPHPETAAVSLFQGPDAYAQFELSWVYPVKVRTTTVIGTQQMAVFDDVDGERPLRVYDRQVARSESPGTVPQFLARDGPETAPLVDRSEPLRGMLDEFLAAVKDPTRAREELGRGLRIAAVLDALDRSLASRAIEPVAPISFPSGGRPGP